MEIAKDIMMVIGFIFSSLVITALIAIAYSEIRDRLNLIHRIGNRVSNLEAELSDFKELRKEVKDNIDSDNQAFRSVWKRIKELEEENTSITSISQRLIDLENLIVDLGDKDKETQIDIEWLKEASAEIRFEVFNNIKKRLKDIEEDISCPETRVSFKTGKVIKSRKRGI